MERIKFDLDELKLSANEMSSTLKTALKYFFNDPQNKILLDNSDFDRLYSSWVTNTTGWSPRPVTAILLLSGIDFLPYLKNIPYNCFYDMPIDYISIPKNIKEINNDAFYRINVSKIYYEGTMEEFKSINLKERWSMGLERVICTDGEINGLQRVV